MVKIKVLESYLVHADPESVPGYLVRNLLVDIGRIDRLIKMWIKSEENLDIINEAEAIFEALPNLEFFEQFPRAASDGFFL